MAAGTKGQALPATSPAVRVVYALPLQTLNGVKRHRTVPTVPCGRRLFREPCMRDVVADDFAWCEEVIPEDFEPS